jgi:hypothetical protein
MTMQRPTRAAVFAMAIVLTPVPALADAAAPAKEKEDVNEARKHWQQGVKLFDEGDYRAALVEFRRAHQLTPAWPVLFNIAQCHYQLLEYPAALAVFEQYLAQGGDQVPADKRTLVEKEVVELRARVAKLTIDVDREGAEILVDGVLIGRAPLAQPIVVAVGTRTVVARKEGYSGIGPGRRRRHHGLAEARADARGQGCARPSGRPHGRLAVDRLRRRRRGARGGFGVRSDGARQPLQPRRRLPRQAVSVVVAR